MSERSVVHDTFTIDRTYDASPARVFSAFADGAAKAKWFSGPPDKWKLLKREFDFRVGGHEHASGAWQGGPVSKFDAVYHEIVPNERIIYTYGMHLDDRRISFSLATLEFKPADSGTRLIVTEQGVFLDGYDDAGSRKNGTSMLLDKLGASLMGE